MNWSDFILVFVSYCVIGAAVEFIKTFLLQKYLLKAQRERVDDLIAQVSRAILSGIVKFEQIKRGRDNG